jgi:hypothetical protein
MAEVRRRIQAAAPHTFVADIPGLIPDEIVAPIVTLRDSVMAPLFAALGPSQAPPGKTFSLPLGDRLPPAAEATEKSDVTHQVKVGTVPVTMYVVKQAVNLSAEAILWSQPSVLDYSVSELADSLAEGCEEKTAALLEAVTGANEALELAADGSDAWTALSAGVAAHYAAVRTAPDLAALAPDLWAALAGMTNPLGVPIIGGINQSLTAGPGGWGTLFGMPVVVSYALTAGKGFFLSRKGVKTWQNGSVNMTTDEPTILGRALGGLRTVGLSVASPKFVTPVGVAAAGA